MRTVFFAVIIALAISPALAQQDPDDPGIQDSIIFIAAVDHFDSSGEYQYCNVEEWAVTDDTVAYCCIPLKWHAPRGGVLGALGTTWWPPWQACWGDSVIVEQNYFRQIYPVWYDTLPSCPPLSTNGERLHFKSQRLIILPNAPSQLVVLDTCVDPLNGAVLFGFADGMTEITPGIQRAFFSIGSVGVDDENLIPASLSLAQNYPNPFNSSTTISYQLPESCPVTLCIYNLLGQKMATLFDGVQQAGEHKVVWEAAGAPSGVYFGRLDSGNKIVVNTMVLLK